MGLADAKGRLPGRQPDTKKNVNIRLIWKYYKKLFRPVVMFKFLVVGLWRLGLHEP